jgi:hypothetical protein
VSSTVHPYGVLNWPTFAVVLFVSITSANILQFLLHSAVVALAPGVVFFRAGGRRHVLWRCTCCRLSFRTK